ncbi:uridine kinase family protein [Cryptosporangium phraense]|uniref:Uridine kinase n=1 Tax=Cryptosporangium phraense TaxID=2593070 RepID=A0A545AJ73_9ACTN|nr:hypothetical protein [Cryptosporangium phraense]TQS41374.1 hypothetical protein FL583_30195 [Cryptosporangium phraense]
MRLHPGEPEATGWRVVPIAEVVGRLRATAPRIIGIDGRGGAGKTTLAERLRVAVPNSAVVHTDDVAWNHAYFDWAGVLTENILRPVRRGEAVDFRPDAWVAHGRPGSITVPAGVDVVWVEGTGVIRAELAEWLDASIWMQGDLDEQERLLVLRDGDSPDQREHVRRWLEEELPFLLREQPWAHATLLVAGPPHLPHDSATELIVTVPRPPAGGMLAR